MTHIWRILRPGGTCYLTVPYGLSFEVHGTDWRVYDRAALRERLTPRFRVEQEVFFKSGECACPESGEDFGGVKLVAAADADRYAPGAYPHVSVFLKLRKQGRAQL